MARTHEPEDAIRMRRVKGSIDIGEDARVAMAEVAFGAGTQMRITGGTLYVETLIPADAENLVEQTAEAERQMAMMGNIRTLTSSYTKISPDDLPPVVGGVDLVEQEESE